jgi:hypothetical protein
MEKYLVGRKCGSFGEVVLKLQSFSGRAVAHQTGEEI